VRLEANTKSHVHNLIHEFFINMDFTMAYPNFKKGLKMVFGPLEVKFLLGPAVAGRVPFQCGAKMTIIIYPILIQLLSYCTCVTGPEINR
jgi:hypothetical protein